jgi:hypothetical protein
MMCNSITAVNQNRHGGTGIPDRKEDMPGKSLDGKADYELRLFLRASI